MSKYNLNEMNNFMMEFDKILKFEKHLECHFGD